MMSSYRIAIIADIHGVLPPLQAVLQEIKHEPPDEIIVAGDFLGGPHPLKTLSLLQESGCRFILGNGEMNMLKMYHDDAPEVWWTHRQFELGRWIYQKLTKDVFYFLETLTEHRVIQPQGCAPFRVVHGSPWDINQLIFPDKNPEVLAKALGMIPEDLLIFAHNHLPSVMKIDRKWAVNPGSVSNNLNGDPRASYATLTWDGSNWQSQINFVSYDPQNVIDAFHESGFLEAARPLARAFLESILTGENTAVNFIHHAFNQANRAGYRDSVAVPDEIWAAAETSFHWKFEF